MGLIKQRLRISGQSYPVVILPTVTHTRVLLVFISRIKIPGAGKVVVGKIYSKLLGIGDTGCYLNGKIRTIFTRKHFTCYFIQDLGNFGRMICGYAKNDCLPYFSRIGSLRAFQKSFAEYLVGVFGEKPFFKVLVDKYFFNIFSSSSSMVTV
jgi:hypothetical protein